MAKPKAVHTKLQIVIPIEVIAENDSRFDLAQFQESVIEYFTEHTETIVENLTNDQEALEGGIFIGSPIRIEKGAR